MRRRTKPRAVSPLAKPIKPAVVVIDEAASLTEEQWSYLDGKPTTLPQGCHWWTSADWDEPAP